MRWIIGCIHLVERQFLHFLLVFDSECLANELLAFLYGVRLLEVERLRLLLLALIAFFHGNMLNIDRYFVLLAVSSFADFHAGASCFEVLDVVQECVLVLLRVELVGLQILEPSRRPQVALVANLIRQVFQRVPHYIHLNIFNIGCTRDVNKTVLDILFLVKSWIMLTANRWAGVCLIKLIIHDFIHLFLFLVHLVLILEIDFNGRAIEDVELEERYCHLKLWGLGLIVNPRLSLIAHGLHFHRLWRERGHVLELLEQQVDRQSVVDHDLRLIAEHLNLEPNRQYSLSGKILQLKRQLTLLEIAA